MIEENDQDLATPSNNASPPPRFLPRPSCPPWSRLETFRLVSTVLSLNGDPSFPDGGWDDRVEETAKWVEVAITVGGEREMRDVVRRWAEVRFDALVEEENRADEDSVETTTPIHAHAGSFAVPADSTAAIPSVVGQPVSRQKRNWTTEETRLLTRLSLEGASLSQMVDQVGRSEELVSKRLGKIASQDLGKVQREEREWKSCDDGFQGKEPAEMNTGDSDFDTLPPSPAGGPANASSGKGSAPRKRRPWTTSEDDTLHRLDGEGVSHVNIAQQLDRTAVAVAIRLGIRERAQKSVVAAEPLRSEVDQEVSLHAASPEQTLKRRGKPSQAALKAEETLDSEVEEIEAACTAVPQNTRFSTRGPTFTVDDTEKIRQWRSQGVIWREIASRLGRKNRSVRMHWTNVRRKEGVASAVNILYA
ncbi:hypothetical protein JCM11251_007957 [Rhodosporidiobolus azoricus]